MSRAGRAMLALHVAVVLTGMCSAATGGARQATTGSLARHARARRMRELRVDLADAVRAQQFSLAASLKRKRDELREEDPVWQLREALARAVSAQDFRAAAQVRDELERVVRVHGDAADLLVLTSPGGERAWTLAPEEASDGLGEGGGGSRPDRAATELTPAPSADGATRLMQPTWSPSGTRVAATLLRIGAARDAAGGGETLRGCALVIFDARSGAESIRCELPFPPFYLQWAADEATVTCLGQPIEGGGGARQGGLCLLAVDIRSTDVRVLARGAPLFYSLRPAASEQARDPSARGDVDAAAGADRGAGGGALLEMIAHNGGADAVQLLRMPARPAFSLVDAPADASIGWRTLSAPGGGFQAPWWCAWRAEPEGADGAVEDAAAGGAQAGDAEPAGRADGTGGRGALREALVFVDGGKLVACAPPDATGADAGAGSGSAGAAAAWRAGRRVLVRNDDADGEDSPMFFVVDRRARRLALLRSVEEPKLEILEGVSRGGVCSELLAQARGGAAVPAPALRTVPVDLDRCLPPGEAVRAVEAFWFSPAGRWLLVLVRIGRPAETAAADELGTPTKPSWRWVVWDAQRAQPLGATPPCVPSVAARAQYFPFFTQYAQSASPFAPDGGAFCFAADGAAHVATLRPDAQSFASRVSVERLGGDVDVVWWSTRAAADGGADDYDDSGW